MPCFSLAFLKNFNEILRLHISLPVRLVPYHRGKNQNNNAFY